MQDLEIDCIILGGGVGGLWLLNRLRNCGYSTILLEAKQLGFGQTICSQGIIHGGTKYAVNQLLTSIAQEIAAMPKLWRDCLKGIGEIDLSSVERLAEQQQLWVPGNLTGKFVGFLTSKALQSRVSRLAPLQFPALFQFPGFKGEVYALDEPVLNVATLIRALAQPHAQHIYRYFYPEGIAFNKDKPSIILTTHSGAKIQLQAKKIIFTAGAGNELFLKILNQNSKILTQRRPLHMLMLKGLPQHLYAHIIDNHFKPFLTITSYNTETDEIVWYIGGEVAVRGVAKTPQQLFSMAIQPLQTLLPQIDFAKLAWCNLRIDRAEPWYQHRLPDKPVVIASGNYLVAWPVKLAFAPLLACNIMQLLEQQGIAPSRQETPLLPGFEFPGYASLPWKENIKWN